MSDLGAVEPAQSRAAAPVDWVEARRLYEQDGRTFTAIAKLAGCKRQTVAARAKREGWIERTLAVRAGAAAALRSYIERQRDEVLENLSTKHGLNRRLLALVETHIARLEADRLLYVESGTDGEGRPIYVAENPIKSIRDLSATVKTIEDVDAGLLRDGAWHESGAVPTDGVTPPGTNFRDALRPPQPALARGCDA